jgi:hypothetical protein
MIYILLALTVLCSTISAMEQGSSIVPFSAQNQKTEEISKLQLSFLQEGFKSQTKNLPINIQDYDDNTPLHWAAKMNDIKAAKLLLEKDASLTIQNNNGSTPLHLAISHKHSDVAELFLGYNKDNSLVQETTYSQEDIEKLFSQIMVYLLRSQRNMNDNDIVSLLSFQSQDNGSPTDDHTDDNVSSVTVTLPLSQEPTNTIVVPQQSHDNINFFECCCLL